MNRPRHSIVIVTCPPNWRPGTVNSVPPSFAGGRYFAKNLTRGQARIAASVFNRAHLPSNGAFDGTWAIVASPLKKGFEDDSKDGEIVELVILDREGNEQALPGRLPRVEAAAFSRGFNIAASSTDGRRAIMREICHIEEELVGSV